MNDNIEVFPVLETDRFILRRITLDDAKEIYDYFSKDEVTQYYDLDSFTDIQQAINLIERWDERFKGKQSIRWGIARREDNIMIGSCGYHNWAHRNFKAEIGYELSPLYWRQGVMTEVLTAIIAHGFEHMKLHRIEAFYDPANIASKKSLLKAGFKYEGLLRESFFEKGRFVDAEICSLLASDTN
ncbi:GNAT family N-acetyltransferase [Paenibacillus odorifer]|nr:GNAT family N-acetyltransferase [Paenibacillus odorifer]